MSKKEKKPDDLDTETTFADMNVEGFAWYDPTRKKNGGKKGEKIKLTGKERWAMFKAGVSVLFPYLIGTALVFAILYLLMKLWLM